MQNGRTTRDLPLTGFALHVFQFSFGPSPGPLSPALSPEYRGEGARRMNEAGQSLLASSARTPRRKLPRRRSNLMQTSRAVLILGACALLLSPPVSAQDGAPSRAVTEIRF